MIKILRLFTLFNTSLLYFTDQKSVLPFSKTVKGSQKEKKQQKLCTQKSKKHKKEKIFSLKPGGSES